jgi:hypothetical protein
LDQVPFVVADRLEAFEELRDMRFVASGIITGEQNGPAGETCFDGVQR